MKLGLIVLIAFAFGNVHSQNAAGNVTMAESHAYQNEDGSISVEFRVSGSGVRNIGPAEITISTDDPKSHTGEKVTGTPVIYNGTAYFAVTTSQQFSDATEYVEVKVAIDTNNKAKIYYSWGKKVKKKSKGKAEIKWY